MRIFDQQKYSLWNVIFIGAKVSSIVERFNENRATYNTEINKIFVLACKSGTFDAVLTFLDSNSVDLEFKFNSSLISPLFVAAYNGQAAVCRLLVLKGANLNSSNELGVTPFYYACLSGDLETIKFFVEEVGIDPETVTFGPNRISPFHLASAQGSPLVFDYFFRRNFDFNLPDSINITPFIVAISSGNLELVKWFVEVYRIDVNQRVTGFYSPLFVAAYFEHSDICEYLLLKG